MVHLLIKTEYSMLQSHVRIPEIVAFASKQGIHSLAITDTNMHAAFQFYQACKRAGITAIIGYETTIDQQQLVMYAKNQRGYQSLLSYATTQDPSSLYSNEDIIVVTRGTTVPVRLPFIHFYFGLELDELEIEVQIAPAIVALAQEEQIELVMLSEVRYLEPSDAKYLKVLQAIEAGQTLSLAELSPGQQYARSATELENLYADYPKAIENALLIASQCKVTLDYEGYLLPSFPTEHDPHDYLVALSTKGLQKRYDNKEQPLSVYQERLAYELELLQRMGFDDYMLIVYDFVRYAKSQNILVGPGRGSVAGSLVAYCLGITNTDPIEYELLFERFLNPDRITMPDIDLDFPDDKREELLLYAKEKYGNDHVASIVTFGTFAARSAVRDVAKVLSLDNAFVNEVMKFIPAQGAKLHEVILDKNVVDLMSRYPEVQQVMEIALQIEGHPRHSSTHAAGIIIAKEPLLTYTALQQSSGPLQQTQFEAYDLESIGLLKIDFLGLSNLKILDQTTRLIEKYTNEKINLYQMQFNDTKTFELMREGKTQGVFQLESRGIRRVLHDLEVSTFEDVVATLALFRPGPMDFIPEFIARKKGKQVEYPHPSIEAILAPTYGIIVYQEQIMRIANEFAGYSYAQADLLRRAVAKKDKDMMQAQRSEFISMSIAKGRDEDDGIAIFDLIDRFANYGFNRSHSVAYAMIAYQTAYFKANYPLYYLAVLLSHHVGSTDNTKLYIAEAMGYQIPVYPPRLNQSGLDYQVVDGGLLMPFVVIKGISTTMATKIIEARDKPFTSALDVIERLSPLLNKTHWQGLIDSGALDKFGVTKKAWSTQFDDAMKFLSFGSLIDDAEFRFIQDEFDEATLMAQEKAVIGIALTHNPFAKFANLRREGYEPLVYLNDHNKVKTIAMISSVKVIQTKTAKSMAFVTIQDDTMVTEAVVFPDLYETHHQFLKQGMMMKCELTKQTRQGKQSIIIQHMETLK
jgi:DNA polymerase III subunit alpha